MGKSYVCVNRMAWTDW